jgi:hypothetical protein
MKEKERTTIMSPEEETIYPQSSIAQLGVGKLEIRAQALPSYGKEEIIFSHEIIIYDDSKDTGGWGEKIFEGTLKELIDFIKEVKSGPNVGKD